MDLESGEGNMSFEVRLVSKHYGDKAVLSNLTLKIASGDNLAILGSSGCGKSTLLRLLAGLEPPSAGQIFLNGQLASDTACVVTPPHHRGIGMVFQDLGLWPNLSVLENVLLAISGQRLSKSESRDRAREALSLCKIESLSSELPSKISGGEQQRVALARALAFEPEFLFLDEPFSGLDLVIKSSLLNDISRLASEKKISLVLVSHDPAEARRLCKSIIVLSNGKIAEQGALSEVFRSPKSQILRLFNEQCNTGDLK
jgi:iron(III) transport system ATP-binding protein